MVRKMRGVLRAVLCGALREQCHRRRALKTSCRVAKGIGGERYRLRAPKNAVRNSNVPLLMQEDGLTMDQLQVQCARGRPQPIAAR
jgi:hypothetical protein